MVSTPKNPNLKSFDPYQNMERSNIRPKNIKKSTSYLRNAEASAVLKNTNSNNLISSEKNQKFRQFKNNVKGKPLKKFSFLKKRGALITILCLIAAASSLSFSAQSILAPHLSDNYTQATDVQFISYDLRNPNLFKFFLNGDGQIKQTLFTEKFTTFTPYMKSRLSNTGIEVGKINASGHFSKGDFMAGKSRVLRYNGEIITANNFRDKYANDINFRENYYKAKRGRVAGFFDKSSSRVYHKGNITRNNFKNHKTTGDNSSDNKSYKNTMSKKLNGSDTGIGTAKYETEVDENGNETTKLVENGETTKIKNIKEGNSQSKARALINSTAKKISTIGGPTCAILRVANMINIAAAVTHTLNSINYFMGMMENISKMMAGEGDSSAVNTVLNFLTTPTTNEIQEIDKDGNSSNIAVTGSPLESNGSRVILGGLAPIKYRSNAYSLESIINTASRTILLSRTTSVTCSGVQAASAIVSLTATAIPGGGVAKMLVAMLAKTVGSIVITGAIASVVSAIVPIAAKMLFSNIMDDFTGIPAGELFNQGAAASNFKLSRNASATMPSSEAVLAVQNRINNEVIAREAELDRKNRSPFDVTNKNTFFGNIIINLLPIFTKSKTTSPLSTITQLSNKTFASFNRSVLASDNQNTYITTYGDCPSLTSIGVKGDIYCNPIPASDLSTTKITPDDPIYENILSPNLKSDGKSIKDDSELAKFINFCVNRESPFGVTDANILNALQLNAGIVINNLPFLNNIIDLVNAAKDITNQAWATGANCVNSAENPRWNNEFKYYQRYIEDLRILDQMGTFKDSKNPILAYQDKYDLDHPIDTSFSGTLARLSGYTKNDVAFLLEFAKYSDFVANYDSSNLYPYYEKPLKVKKLSQILQSKEYLYEILITNSQSILYKSTRNRNYAI